MGITVSLVMRILALISDGTFIDIGINEVIYCGGRFEEYFEDLTKQIEQYKKEKDNCTDIAKKEEIQQEIDALAKMRKELVGFRDKHRKPVEIVNSETNSNNKRNVEDNTEAESSKRKN